VVKAKGNLRTVSAVSLDRTVRAKVAKTNAVIAVAYNRTVRAKGAKDEPI